MEIHEMKQLARRLRGALGQAGASVSHGQALDLIAAVAGLRNWPEVTAFPKRLAEASVTDESVSRLRLRVEAAHAIALEQGPLIAALNSVATSELPERGAPTTNMSHAPTMLPVDLYTSAMPTVFSEFKAAIGESHWLGREKRIKEEIRGAPYLREYLQAQNDVALALTRCSSLADRYGQIPPEAINDRSLYPAFRLAAQMLSLMSSNPKRTRQIARRIHGAFKNPDEMRAIQFELGIATHFIRRGHAVAWPEMTGMETFDLLATDLGVDGLEIECKSASIDKGRKVHRREALECLDAVREQLEKTSRNLHSGLSVVLTIPNRLPTEYRARTELYSRIGSIVMEGKPATLLDGSDVRISDFDIRSYPRLGPEMTPQVRLDVDKITGTSNREVMILGRRNGGALVFVLQSAKEDSFLSYVFDAVDYAARRQLSAKRGGVVLVGLDGITPDQLVETAEQDRDSSQPPTALRVAVSEFLRDTSKDHLVGVGFVSRESLIPSADGQVSSGGTAYYFPRKESPLWHANFGGLFAGLHG